MTYLAVIDVETTGLNPYRHDRVIEIAALMMRTDGEIIREFVTLVNPERDVGPTSIHGITASDVVAAPRFVEIVGMLIDALNGCVVLVGHNIRFDYSFLSAEFRRLAYSFPDGPTRCTMQLAGGGTLSSCCRDYSVNFEGQRHSALHDARATAQLLATLLQDAPQELSEIVHLSPIRWPKITNSETRLLTRDESRTRLAETPTYLEKLLVKAEINLIPETDNSAILAYSGLLDQVLEDRCVDETEAQALLDLATQWGIGAERTQEIHRHYLRQLTRAAMADDVITETERSDLRKVAFLLGIYGSELDEILKTVSHDTKRERSEKNSPLEPARREHLTGKRVCFTGELQCRHLGQMITRERATELATNHRMIVVERVSKKLDVLVVADLLSQSGKARKVRKYGIPIMHEAIFWKLLGIEVN